MTLTEACEKARTESENGYVQHVERIIGADGMPHGYRVSDWYDADTTVRSYENGYEIHGK